jgi:hypothetical protein
MMRLVSEALVNAASERPRHQDLQPTKRALEANERARN